MIADTLVVGEIPAEPPGFVDRTELADLARLLGERGRAVVGAGGRAVVGAGGRGVGKTALAAAYARTAIADPAGPRVVVWVSGENTLALTTGLAALAHRANLTLDGETGEQTAARARDYLTGLGAPSLLVIDNAEHPDRVRPWLPATRTCQVLLTSTDQTFTALATGVPVGTYPRTQSIAYLNERTGIHDPDGADQLAEALGDLPLALAQAAAVITTRHLTYPRYLTRLTATTLTLALPPEPGYPRGLTAAIHLSTQTATAPHPPARVVADLLSVLDPNGVTRTLLTTLLTAWPGEDLTEDDVDQAIGILAGGSLVTLTTDNSSLLMHRLVARTLRETHT